ncbi:MAG: hypothetical protein IPK02_18645 [Candidatus Accumulibacter sp.]|uniref:Uncharacterized protein n=1 Tax=Candidatus Accumulibacter affinis TaxID=2954384 RepID=A0A935TEC2_9PROT|nr:hypothetical protein [Candidatus Accumulibacter affinis]
MGLNEIREEFGSEISSMAEDLNNSLPFSKPQLRSAFTDSEIGEIHKLIKDVNSATAENQKIARLQANAKAAFGLLKKLGVAL